MTAPVTFYKVPPPVGISAWHRHWLKAMRAREASVPCDGCAAPCCTSFEFITLDPTRDDVSQYETKPLVSGGVGLQQREDGSCVYFIEGRCSIHTRRPSICRVFDCRMYQMVPDDHVLDTLQWSGPARTCAERLRDTAVERFPFTAKEPDDHTFFARFFPRFLAGIQAHPEWDMSQALMATLLTVGRSGESG